MAVWSPDSCECVINVGSDWTFSGFITKCPAHSALTDNAAWDAIWRTDNRGENQRGPGNTLKEMIDNAPSGMYDQSPDGSRQWKQGINVTWAWSGTAPNRVLNVTVTGFTPTANQQNAIKAKLDTRFGAGNVVVTYAA